MSTYKGKGIASIPSSDKGSKEKAIWDNHSTGCFIEACLKQLSKGERTSTTFSKRGWDGIEAHFYQKSGRKYDKLKLRNKWDGLRKEWKLWCKLLDQETGLEWDNTRKTIDASDEWWEEKLLENPDYKIFRNKGFPFANELSQLFKDVAVTGQFTWGPSSRILPAGIKEGEDDYCSGFDADLQEGSADNDAIIGNRGVATLVIDFGNMNSVGSQRNPTQSSSRKRTRDEAGQLNQRKKKDRQNILSQFCDAVSRIATASEARTAILNSFVDGGVSYDDVMSELMMLEPVNTDLDWHCRCCNLLTFKAAREVFMALKPYPEKLLHWLKVTAYNPPSNMR